MYYKIKEIINNPNFDKKQALKAQEAILIKKSHRLRAIIKARHETIAALENNTVVSSLELFSAFDMAEIERNKEKYRMAVRLKFGNAAQRLRSIQKKIGLLLCQKQVLFLRISVP